MRIHFWTLMELGWSDDFRHPSTAEYLIVQLLHKNSDREIADYFQ
jgi:hypothetical protein